MLWLHVHSAHNDHNDEIVNDIAVTLERVSQTNHLITDPDTGRFILPTLF